MKPPKIKVDSPGSKKPGSMNMHYDAGYKCEKARWIGYTGGGLYSRYIPICIVHPSQDRIRTARGKLLVMMTFHSFVGLAHDKPSAKKNLKKRVDLHSWKISLGSAAISPRTYPSPPCTSHGCSGCHGYPAVTASSRPSHVTVVRQVPAVGDDGSDRRRTI